MIKFPLAKINLGLNVVERRPDGYHNLNTVFFPVNIRDAIEVFEMDEKFPSAVDCDLKVTGISIDGEEQKNLVVKAYQQLKADFPQLPRLHVHLHKHIPTQAGMGGGSSDGTAMLTLLNSEYRLGLTREQLIERAARLGADCPFFVDSRPAYAEGIGERLTPIDIDLSGYWICVVRPNIPVSTREAFSLVTPKYPSLCCRDVVMQPVESWRDSLTNDFEKSVFAIHPKIGSIKQRLYDLGAVYAAMSGSGSALFGLFREPVDAEGLFGGEGVYAACLPCALE